MAGFQSVMAGLQPDSGPFPNPLEPQDHGSAIKVGIFHADADVHIASRIHDKLKEKGCDAKKFNFLNAGQLKMEVIEEFITSKKMVLWIATRTSLRDEGILKVARHMAHYASVVKKDLGIRYVTFQPREYLHECLPLALDMYSTLREDELLHERLDDTIKSVRKSLSKLPRHGAQGQSTATPSAVGGEVPELSRLPPNSDEELQERMSIMRVQGGGEIPVEAVSDGSQYGRNKNVEASGEHPSIPTDAGFVSADVVNVIHVHGSNVNIGGTLTTTGMASATTVVAKSSRENNDKNDGTPV